MKKKTRMSLVLARISPCIGFDDVQEMRLTRKKMWPTFVLACMTGFSAAACAASTSTDGGAAVDAALKTCAASVAKDSRGGPDQAAMTACMTKAGFTKPSQGGEHMPPPPTGTAPRK